MEQQFQCINCKLCFDNCPNICPECKSRYVIELDLKDFVPESEIVHILPEKPKPPKQTVDLPQQESELKAIILAGITELLPFVIVAGFSLHLYWGQVNLFLFLIIVLAAYGAFATFKASGIIKKKKAIGSGLICAPIAFLFLFALHSFAVEKESPPTTPPRFTLNAEVVFNGTQFIIKNNDDFHWINIDLAVNPGPLSQGYKLKMISIKSGASYTIGAKAFAKSNGEKLNPFTHKPQSISIYCDTLNGQGKYYGSLE